MVDGEEAHNLYRLLHRSSVAVIQTGTAYVKTKPRSQTVRKKELIPIEQFVRYKSYFAFVDPNNFGDGLNRFLKQADAWSKLEAIHSITDPRCLPLHVISPETIHDGLDTAIGRKNFRQLHGSNPYKSHGQRFVWNSARDHHAKQPKDALKIGGFSVPLGRHWDVNHQRRGKSGVEISNSMETWVVSNGGHINVYPDAKLRGTKTTRKLQPLKNNRRR